jgi:hypothetical protein
MQMIKVRIKATGQIQEMIPNVARAMIAGGTAELVEEKVETSSLKPAERAVAPGQGKTPKTRTAR